MDELFDFDDDSQVSPEEEAEFRRKIQEVARSNEGFSDLVDRYLGKDD